MNDPTTLYRAFDADGRLLYVGITYDRSQRLGEHSMRAAWSHLTKRLEFEDFPTREAAAAAELEVIRQENPVWNIGGRRLDDARRARMEYLGLTETDEVPYSVRRTDAKGVTVVDWYDLEAGAS